MEQFWVVNDPHEGSRWFAALFEREADTVSPDLRAEAFRSFGSATAITG